MVLGLHEESHYFPIRLYMHLYVCTHVHVSAVGCRVSACFPISCCKKVGIYAEGNVFTQLVCVCVFVRGRGADGLCSAASGCFKAIPFVLPTSTRAYVKDTVGWHKNMWV